MHEVIKISVSNLIKEVDSKIEQINKFTEFEETSEESDFDINFFSEIKICLKEIQSDIEIVKETLTNLENTNEDSFNKFSSILANCQMANSATLFLIDWLNKKAHSIKQGIGNVASNAISWVTGTFLPWLTGTVLPWLGNLLQLVWSSIQAMTTVKEWKIKGTMGNNFLGFASSEIEITFSKPPTTGQP